MEKEKNNAFSLSGIYQLLKISFVSFDLVQAVGENKSVIRTSFACNEICKNILDIYLKK